MSLAFCHPHLDEATLRERLCRAGVTPTSRRLLVAGCIMGRDDHPMAEDIYEALKQAGHDISLATVYNTLGRFVAAGLLQTVQRAGESLRYDPNTEPHHHYLDTETGRIYDVAADAVRIELTQPDAIGGSVERLRVFIEGQRHPAAAQES